MGSNYGPLLEYLEDVSRYCDIVSKMPIDTFASTNKDTVWAKNKARLYHYHSRRRIKYRTPVLFAYALINRASLLDLMPGQSLVEHLLKEGYDVYLLDWGTPGLEDKEIGFGDLVFDYVDAAVKKVLQISGSTEANLIGYCMGGTILCMYAGLNQKYIQNLVLMSSPVSFANAGQIEYFINQPAFDVERLVRTFGLVPAEFIDTCMRMLNPAANYVSKYSRLWRLLRNGEDVTNWVAVNKWSDEGIHFYGQAFKEWINDLYRNNLLVKGRFTLRGQTVKLKNITCPVLALAGQKDLIVIEHQVQAIVDCVSSRDVHYHGFNTGHGGLAFGSTARGEVYTYLANWLNQRSELKNRKRTG